MGILSYKIERLEKVIAWGRYLHWCDLHRKRFQKWIEIPHDVSDAIDGWHFVALASQWYASLWVVIEGWAEAKLKDQAIDELLEKTKNNNSLLKRYRNGIYHFQPSLLEPRLVDFLKESEKNVMWIHAMHFEFLRFFWNYVHSIPGNKNKQEFHEQVIAILGWMPTDIPDAYQWDVEQLCNEANTLVYSSDDASSTDSKELLSAASDACVQVEKGAERYREWIQDLIDAIKTNKTVNHISNIRP